MHTHESKKEITGRNFFRVCGALVYTRERRQNRGNHCRNHCRAWHLQSCKRCPRRHGTESLQSPTSPTTSGFGGLVTSRCRLPSDLLTISGQLTAGFKSNAIGSRKDWSRFHWSSKNVLSNQKSMCARHVIHR